MYNEYLERLLSQPFAHKTVINDIPARCLIDQFIVE